MPLFENNPPNPETKPTNNSEQKTPQNTGLFSLPPQVMNFVPWMPLMLEMMTGQKIPQMSGTIGEMQTTLLQIQSGMQTMVNNQQQLAQRLIALETNASNQLTNLTNQFNSLRLTHTKEKKEIAYNNPPNSESNEDY